MVVTFRNIHNWMAQGTTPQVFATISGRSSRAACSGSSSIGAPRVPQDPKAKSGYVNEDTPSS